MKHGKFFIIGAAVLAALLLLAPQSLYAAGNIMNTAAEFVKSNEGFSATPYWDVSRYSWGYGTQAPGATGNISEGQATADLAAHLQGDYEYLNGLINVPLNTNQWAALLDFSYQLGTGNADNLVPNINRQDWDAFSTQLRLYNKVRDTSGNLVYSANSAGRRERELQLFFS